MVNWVFFGFLEPRKKLVVAKRNVWHQKMWTENISSWGHIKNHIITAWPHPWPHLHI